MGNFCPNCGNNTDPSWKVCPNCGENLEDLEDSQISARPSYQPSYQPGYQPSYQQQAFQPGLKFSNGESKGKSVASFVLGLVAIGSWLFFALIPLVLGVVAIILGIVALTNEDSKPFPIIGMICGSIAIFLEILYIMGSIYFYV